MTARDGARARRAPATGLTGLLADEAKELGSLARRAVPTRRRAGILGVALLALLALSGVAGAAEPDPANRSALDAWGASAAPVVASPAAGGAVVAPVVPVGSAAPAETLPAGALGASPTFAGPDLLDLGLKAGLVIVLLFATLRVLKRVQGGGPHKKAGQLLDVVETRTIGPKTQLHLIAVGDRRLVIGQSPAGLVALGELDAAELPMSDAAAILDALGVPADEPAASRARPEPAPSRTRPEPVPARLLAGSAREASGGRPAPRRDPSPSRSAAPRPAAERPVTDRPAPDRADRPLRPMDVRVAAYARPIADLDALDELDALAAARPGPVTRPAPPASVTPAAHAAAQPAPRPAAPSVDERVARAAARARADRTAAAARAERIARVDRALAAADRAALVAERAAEAAERAAAAADRAAEPTPEAAARARLAVQRPTTAPVARPAGRTPVPASTPATALQPRAAAAPDRAADQPTPEGLVALALRLAQAGRGRDAQVERAASALVASPATARMPQPAAAPAAPETDIAAFLAALAAEPAEDLPVERPRATRRLEVSA